VAGQVTDPVAEIRSAGRPMLAPIGSAIAFGLQQELPRCELPLSHLTLLDPARAIAFRVGCFAARPADWKLASGSSLRSTLSSYGN